MRLLARSVAALLLVLGMAACGGGDGGGSGGSEGNGGSAQESPDQIDTSAPEAESTDGTEQGDTGGGGGAVAVELPGLPIGGSSTVVSDTLQCVDVSWSGPPALPEGWGVTVTGVSFDPSSDFATSGEDCPGDAPSCLASGVQVTASGGCSVAVTWTAQNTDGGEMSFTSGVVSCPPEAATECQGFRGQVESDGPQSITLEPSPTTGGSTDGETENPESQDTGSTDTQAPETQAPDTQAPDTGATDGGG